MTDIKVFNIAEHQTAKDGDRILCENGHHVCTIERITGEIAYYDFEDKEFKQETVTADQLESLLLTDWQQAEPECGTGSFTVMCDKCNALAIVNEPNTE